MRTLILLAVVMITLLSSCGVNLSSVSTYYRHQYTTDSTVIDVTYDSTITYLNR